MPVEQMDDAVGIPCIMLRMGHHDDGRPLAVQFAEQAHHLLAVLGIQVSRRLVGQNQLRTGHDGTGNGRALLLSSGNLYNPQIEMFARFKMKSSFHKTKRII